MKPIKITALLATSALLVSACAVAPGMSDQEVQIKEDLSVDYSMPATRQMREAIETQPLFAQAAFWSNEYDLNPGDLEAAIKLAAAVRKLGNPNRAVEITQTTRALYPRDPYLLAEYAAALIAAERAYEAMQPLDEALARTPAYGRLWSLKGAALDQQERYGEARQYYNRALQITPNDPSVLANIGFSYALSGDAATAEQWLRRALAQPGASPSVRQNLALVLKLQGKTEEAEKMAALAAPQPNLANIGKAGLRGNMPAQAMSQPSMISSGPASSQSAPPRARMMTGRAPGQSFSSASEAARAMAARQSQSQTGPVVTAPKASPEAQQAMLDRIARSLQTQPAQATPLPSRPVQSAQPYAPTQMMQQPVYGAPQMAGGPVQQQSATPTRRQAARPRR